MNLIILAKSNSPNSVKSSEVDNLQTDVPVDDSMKSGKNSFSKYLQKASKVKKLTVDYCHLYEALDRDIREFNRELEYFNKKNRVMFDKLIANIEALIKRKFPGIC